MKALLIATLLVAALPAQHAKLVVTGTQNFASAGSLCDAWSCVPSALKLSPGEGIRLMVTGSLALLISAQLPSCTPIPGIDGSLIVQFPLIEVPLAVSWGRFYGTCVPWIGFASLSLPVVPVGSRFVLQGFSVLPGPSAAVSTAVEVTIR